MIIQILVDEGIETEYADGPSVESAVSVRICDTAAYMRFDSAESLSDRQIMEAIKLLLPHVLHEHRNR